MRQTPNRQISGAISVAPQSAAIEKTSSAPEAGRGKIIRVINNQQSRQRSHCIAMRGLHGLLVH
jgi:hypothetical protein